VAYNFQTGDNKIKLLTEYEDVTQKVLFGDVVTELSMEKIHLQIMLSDVG